jgi:hypothetical protein
MLTAEAFYALMEHKLLTYGTVETVHISITGHKKGSYSMRLARVSGKSPDKASLLKELYTSVQDAARELRATPGGHPKVAEAALTWLVPSRSADDYWVRAHHTTKTYPAHTERGGKWLLFVPTPDVDTHWEQVLQALDAGALGESAKVSTALKNPRETSPDKRVICVYTYDADDYADVSRVRQALRDIGYTRNLAYKMDNTTLAGQYSSGGRVSRYYE